GRAHSDVIVGIVGLRSKQLDDGIDDIFRFGESRIGQSGDVGAARPDIHNLAVPDPYHAAARDTDHAHVERIDVRLVATDPRIFDRRTSVPDNTDIGAGAADLEIDAVGHTQMHQGAGDACGWTGKHGHGRAPAHLGDVHHAAVTAHDHQGRQNSGFANAGLGHDSGIDHLRQDAGIDHGRARPGRQAVKLCNFVTAGCGEAGVHHQTAYFFFRVAVVDSEGRTGDDDLYLFGLQFLDRLAAGV